MFRVRNEVRRIIIVDLVVRLILINVVAVLLLVADVDFDVIVIVS